MQFTKSLFRIRIRIFFYWKEELIFGSNLYFHFFLISDCTNLQLKTMSMTWYDTCFLICHSCNPSYFRPAVYCASFLVLFCFGWIQFLLTVKNTSAIQNNGAFLILIGRAWSIDFLLTCVVDHRHLLNGEQLSIFKQLALSHPNKKTWLFYFTFYTGSYFLFLFAPCTSTKTILDRSQFFTLVI